MSIAISPEKGGIERDTAVFESLLKERVIIPCHDSPVRTPIFPVKKITSNTSEPVTWRFVQDLQAVNSAVIARAARVPNPYTILSQIPQNAMYFTVVDLANAFFSVPVEGKKVSFGSRLILTTKGTRLPGCVRAIVSLRRFTMKRSDGALNH